MKKNKGHSDNNFVTNSLLVPTEETHPPSVTDSRGRDEQAATCFEQNKAGKPPLFMDMCLWEKRLRTFPPDFKSISLCQYSCEELAVGGFFFTGSGDCVRCFYCGLGLKSWSPTENMYVEHQRYRPNCGFLRRIVASDATVNLDLLTKETKVLLPGGASLSDEDTLCLLQMENRYLKQQQLCRMCFRHGANELLLPCGELIICQHCCDIVSRCPSCHNDIVATTTVYLA